MPTQDQALLDSARAHPRIVDLWWALAPLGSTVRFMQSGAHPDDETSAMLAALAFRDGLNLSYACSTRGEGGQNDIGTEGGADLGALRTREMERACDVLAMRMYWHSEGPDDPITDFGFSKHGTETLARWGHARTLARFVEIVRTERPDILCPTFLDISGQHGHHRAMTQAAHEVMAAAADPSFASNLPVWQVRKLYLPAWSGAGQAYDDDAPPPPATLTVSASGRDPVSGWSWERIGQMSRGFHRTQGMGRWVAAGPGRDWPLHLAETHVEGPDERLGSGLPETLADLAEIGGAAAGPLRAAGAAIEACRAAFPDFAAVGGSAAEALQQVRRAKADCPDEARDEIAHRLAAKEVQLGHVLRLAFGAEARARTLPVWLHPGDRAPLVVESDGGDAETVEVTLDLPAGWDVADGTLSVSAEAGVTDAYRPTYDPLAPAAPAVILSVAGADVRLPFDTAPVVLPARLAELSPDAAVINLRSPARSLDVSLSGLYPAGARPGFDLPAGWGAEIGEGTASLTLPQDAAPGLYALPLTLDGAPARTVRRIDYPHIDATARDRAAELRVLVLDAALPEARVGYIGSGHDLVGHWLTALGADVTEVTDAMLASDTALAAFDTLVIGIFALRFRPGLAETMGRINGWVERGGTLVTLYHRPWDNWDADATPPRRLEIGQPSLRWRVTDEAAEVRHLAEHQVLSAPNRIGPEDWAGWQKERGLYFAKSWDDAYTPLLEMADPGEAPHQGALLVADIGAGRHVHTSLILHHQMAQLVPGAFRLMANLITPR